MFWDEWIIVGLDCTPGKHVDADFLPGSAWNLMSRPLKWVVRTKSRARPERVKQRIVEEREFKDIRLVDEEVAKMDYRPVACQQTYRLIVLRKNLKVSEPKQERLFENYLYFFYITNDWESTPEQIVFSANDRCRQENVLTQLKSSRALHAPVDSLWSNGAYMQMTALAWNLKAWLSLSLPVGKQEKPAERQTLKHRLLVLEFRTFVQGFLRVRAQVVQTARQLVVRLLMWNVWQPLFFRLAAQFQSHPRRC